MRSPRNQIEKKASLPWPRGNGAMPPSFSSCCCICVKISLRSESWECLIIIIAIVIIRVYYQFLCLCSASNGQVGCVLWFLSLDGRWPHHPHPNQIVIYSADLLLSESHSIESSSSLVAVFNCWNLYNNNTIRAPLSQRSSSVAINIICDGNLTPPQRTDRTDGKLANDLNSQLNLPLKRTQSNVSLLPPIVLMSDQIDTLTTLTRRLIESLSGHVDRSCAGAFSSGQLVNSQCEWHYRDWEWILNGVIAVPSHPPPPATPNE